MCCRRIAAGDVINIYPMRYVSLTSHPTVIDQEEDGALVFPECADVIIPFVSCMLDFYII